MIYVYCCCELVCTWSLLESCHPLSHDQLLSPLTQESSDVFRRCTALRLNEYDNNSYSLLLTAQCISPARQSTGLKGDVENGCKPCCGMIVAARLIRACSDKTGTCCLFAARVHTWCSGKHLEGSRGFVSRPDTQRPTFEWSEPGAGHDTFYRPFKHRRPPSKYISHFPPTIRNGQDIRWPYGRKIIYRH